MANKKSEKGNYVCKQHFYDIYINFSHEGKGKERKVSGHEYNIYHSRSKLGGGYKTKEEAITKANELYSERVKHNKHS